MAVNSENSPAQPIPGNIIDILHQEGVQGSGVVGYPVRLEQRYQQSPLANGLIRLATFIEPVDRTLGIDPSKNVEKAFKIGELIGLRVVAECVDDVDKAFIEVALLPGIEAPGDADKLHVRQQFASTIIDIGDEAYAAVDEIFDPLFEAWEDRLVPEIRNQRFLRSGFGVPVAYLFARHALDHADDLQLMAAQAKAAESGDFNWDDLLAQ